MIDQLMVLRAVKRIGILYRRLSRNVAVLIAAALLFPLAVVGGAEVESAGITKVVRQYFPEGSEGGLAVLVIKQGEVLHAKGYGLKSEKQPITPDTLMGLASVTKQFAAMCAALLIEEGKLSLSDKVSKHLPGVSLPVGGRELLVQDLLWHTSGLVNFIKSEEKQSIAKYKQEHGLEWLNNRTHAEWLATQALLRDPGTEWEYTNSGYVLLARVVEVVAEKPFHEFQREKIFDVLGMSSTSDSTRFNGSGNMSTTLSDYAKWDRALRERILLGEESSALLFKSGTLDNGDKVNYGFGWKLVFDGDELIEVFHGGVGSPPRSARNFVLRDLRNHITVVFFARENLSFVRAVRQKFASDLRDQALLSGAEP